MSEAAFDANDFKPPRCGFDHTWVPVMLPSDRPESRDWRCMDERVERLVRSWKQPL